MFLTVKTSVIRRQEGEEIAGFKCILDNPVFVQFCDANSNNCLLHTKTACFLRYL